MKTYNYTLSELQQKSVDHLKSMQCAILALSTGTGKTLTILHFIKDLLKDTNDKCIFFIPKSARAAFEKELKTKLCLTNNDYIIVKAGKQISYSEIVKRRYILVENSIVNKYIEDLVSIANNNVCHLVIDEAHSLQSTSSVFAKAAWEVRCYCKRVVAMTATPLMNDIEGLFNLCHFVYPRIFTSWFKFRARYCITKENTIRMKSKSGAVIQRKVLEIVGYQNMKELNEILDKLIIKGCVKYNVNFEFLECPLDEQSEKAYQFASNGLFDYLYHPEKAKKKSGNKDSAEAKDFGSRLHDLQRVVDASDSSFDENFVSNKMKLMCQKVFEIMQRNESTLIYFEYIDTLELAEKILLQNQEMLGFKAIYKLTGAEKEEQRASIESNLGLREIVLCSQAASQSRNLQRANNIICFHCAFSVGRNVQILGRICRYDSTYDHQNIYFISVSDTIDTYKTSLLKKHISLINTLLGMESLGTLDSLADSECKYIDVDVGNERKMLKNTMLWRRDKKHKR